MQHIVDITMENFQQAVLQDSENKIVMVEFWAEGYEPSQLLAPVLEAIAAGHSDSMSHVRVDCQLQQEIAGQFGVQALPTVILVKDGPVSYTHLRAHET